MPFVVRFHTCNVESESSDGFDPIQGIPIPFAVERGATAPERAALRDCLRNAPAVGPDAFETFRVYFPGNVVAEVQFPNLTGDGRVTYGTAKLSDLHPRAVALVFDLARAGAMLVIPDGIARPLVPSEDLRQRAFRRWPNVMVVPTAGHLWRMVEPPPAPPAEDEIVPEPEGEYVEETPGEHE